MAKQVSYGMVGGDIHAFIGEVHRKALNFDTRCELVAGCFSRKNNLNKETGDAYCVESDRLYSDYKTMAADESAREDGIDFVVITTPNNTHYEIAKEFLLSGINVVCEKPLCFEVEEAEELKTIADEKRLIFGVTYAYTGYTMVKVAKEMIANGQIGKIISVNAEYAQDWLLDELSKEHEQGAKNLSIWRTDPKVSGISNCVGDIGSHMENMIHYLTGLSIKRLSATVNNYGHALDLNANMLVEFSNGANGAYWCSQIAAGRMNGLLVRIYGTEGSIEWEQHFPDYIKFTKRGQATQILSRSNSYIKEAASGFGRIPCGHPEGYYICFANTYKNIINSIIMKKNGHELTPADMDFQTVEDGLNGVKFVHAVIESAKNDSKWVIF